MCSLGKTLTLVDDTDYKDESIVAFLGGGSLSWFNKQLLYSKATASFTYAFRRLKMPVQKSMKEILKTQAQHLFLYQVQVQASSLHRHFQI